MKYIGICDNLTELVEVAKQGKAPYDILMWSMVDYLRGLYKRGQLTEALEMMQECPLIGISEHDRYLAAVMESLYLEFKVEVPAWLNQKDRVEGEEIYAIPNLRNENAKATIRSKTTLPPFVKRKLYFCDKLLRANAFGSRC